MYIMRHIAQRWDPYLQLSFWVTFSVYSYVIFYTLAHIVRNGELIEVIIYDVHNQILKNNRANGRHLKFWNVSLHLQSKQGFSY